MKKFKSKGFGVSKGNKLVIFIFFSLIVLSESLGLHIFISLLFSVIVLLSSRRALKKEKAAIKVIYFTEFKIICHIDMTGKPEVIFHKGQYYFKENSKVIKVSKIKGGDELIIIKKDWDKEVIELFAEFGVPFKELPNSDDNLVEKVDNSLSAIYLFRKLFRGFMD